MSETVIKVNSLSKKYRLGQKEIVHDTFIGALQSWLLSPFRNFKNLNKLTTFNKNDDESVLWALKDISFKVNRGEVLGVIGPNGAGKSTLLKILSRITSPSHGSAELTGRVASLLEVGTGFHGELTAKENIYLNGSILGMRTNEIRSKLDQIIKFSGLERFLNTPVKRFSNGMVVRLGFSIAAHLEPEILLVDEVLAVGDVQFQKQCIGKMQDVTKSGRTILFVSHNMGAVRSLCDRLICINKGKIIYDGNVEKGIQEYYNATLTELENEKSNIRDRKDRVGNGDVIITDVRIQDKENKSISPQVSKDVAVELDYETKNSKIIIDEMIIAIWFKDSWGNKSVWLNNSLTGNNLYNMPKSGTVLCTIPKCPLYPGNYIFSVSLKINGMATDKVFDAGSFEILEGPFYDGGSLHFPPQHLSSVLVEHKWEKI